jgi:hypothetical protein
VRVVLHQPERSRFASTTGVVRAVQVAKCCSRGVSVCLGIVADEDNALGRFVLTGG